MTATLLKVNPNIGVSPWNYQIFKGTNIEEHLQTAAFMFPFIWIKGRQKDQENENVANSIPFRIIVQVEYKQLYKIVANLFL